MVWDLFSVLLKDGYGVKAREGAYEHVVPGVFFAFVGIKDRDGGGFSFVCRVEGHRSQDMVDEDLSGVHVLSERCFALRPILVIPDCTTCVNSSDF